MRLIEPASVSVLAVGRVRLKGATEGRMPSHSGTLTAIISPRPLWNSLHIHPFHPHEERKGSLASYRSPELESCEGDP
jgi:hypothetical protein